MKPKPPVSRARWAAWMATLGVAHERLETGRLPAQPLPAHLFDPNAHLPASIQLFPLVSGK